MSTVNHRHKHVFIHVPKCAGTAMERQKFVGGNGHATIATLAPTAPPEYFRWAFVRNPYDRLLSAFAGFQQNPKQEVDQIVATGTFAEWVAWLAAEPDRLELYAHTTPQWRFVMLRRSFGVHYLGRFEQLQPCWRHVQGAIGVPPTPLPLVNRTQHPRPAEAYTEETRSAVYQMYRLDFHLFGYNPEELP